MEYPTKNTFPTPSEKNSMAKSITLLYTGSAIMPPCSAATRLHQPAIKAVYAPLHQFSPLPLPESGAFSRQEARLSTKRHHSAYVPKVSFDRLKRKLEEELSSRFGSVYSGYLGVDMMVCRFPSGEVEYRIHPCVEINLRMNMGVEIGRAHV